MQHALRAGVLVLLSLFVAAASCAPEATIEGNDAAAGGGERTAGAPQTSDPYAFLDAGARNPAQGLILEVTERGLVATLAGARPVAVTLRSSALGRHEAPPLVAPSTTVAGRHAQREWDRASEWYVNGPEGVEHGFTVATSPPGDGPLRLLVTVAGDLLPRRFPGGVVLVDDDGLGRLRYTDLVVVDAEGRRLPSALRVDDRTIVIEIDDAGALYPITIDPLLWVEEQKLFASDVQNFDSGGAVVALDGTTAAIAAINEDDGGSNAGAVYIFTRSGNTWTEQQKLVAFDSQANWSFGTALALSGDTLAIGAPGANDAGSFSGAVYVYRLTGGTFVLEQKLTASDAAAGDRFGTAVGIDGNTLATSSRDDDDLGSNSGAAYVFTRSGSVWAEQQKILASDGAAGDRFGSSVALSGSGLIVGATSADTSAVNAGAAYALFHDGVSWNEEAKLVASSLVQSAQFGFRAALDGDTAVISSYNPSTSDGSAWIFVRTGPGAWFEEAELLSSNDQPGDYYGFAVDVEGDVAVVTARTRDVAVTDDGAAVVFTRSGGVWTEHQEFTGQDASFYDAFGSAVALSSPHLLVGDAAASVAFTDGGGTTHAFLLVNVAATPCSQPSECTTGFCVDGFCCDAACSGRCDVCDDFGFEGICRVLPAGTAPTPSCSPYLCDGLSGECPTSCASTDDCSYFNFCDAQSTCTSLKFQGEPCSGDIECNSGFCRDGYCCNQDCDGSCARCDVVPGQGTCIITPAGADGSPSCAPYLCDGVSTSCPTTCTSDDECETTSHCSQGLCQPDQPLGTSCSGPNECTSGFCVEGVCCGGACGGTCEACDLPATLGHCSFVTGGTDPAAECPGGACNGSGSCAKHDGELCAVGGECLSGHCADGYCCDTACTASCDSCSLAGAEGVCSAMPAGAAGEPTCAPYLCDGSGPDCGLSCSLDSDCASGFWCDGTVCAAQLSLGAACGGSSQCESGFCVDGVCCTSACGGGVANDCEACAQAAGSATDGTCGPVLASANLVCREAAGGCDLAEVCDGVGTACPSDLLAASGTLCRAAAGDCDVDEVCTGVGVDCPDDLLAVAGVVCRAARGDCDETETCDGATPDCPDDGLVAEGTTCRPAEGQCDEVESCSGASVACPPDGFALDGIGCDDGDACTGPDRCDAGVCRAGPDGCDEDPPVIPAAAVAPAENGGCDCRTAGRPPGPTPPWAALTPFLALLFRRRGGSPRPRRRRVASSPKRRHLRGPGAHLGVEHLPDR